MSFILTGCPEGKEEVKITVFGMGDQVDIDVTNWKTMGRRTGLGGK